MSPSPHERFRDFVEKKRAWYRAVGRVYCPVLRTYVVFNSKGFYHLRYDSTKKARPIKEQKYKLGLLPLVIPAIKNAAHVFDHTKLYSRRDKKYHMLWELRSVVGKQNVCISVVVKKVGKGQVAFFSVWKNRKKIKKTVEKRRSF